MSAKSYILRAVVFVVLLVLAVLAFNYSVDPYAITGAKRVEGFNRFKADINDHVRLTKKYQPLLRDHNVLILGNSRVEMGIDPSHACFQELGLNVYNLGIPGASVRGQLEYALNVIYQQPVRRILLSVDFTDFIAPSPAVVPSRNGMREKKSGSLRYLPSGAINPAYTHAMLLDYYKAVFSLDALVSSWKTIALQRGWASDRNESGFNPASDFMNAVRVEGPHALFAQKNQALEQKYGKRWYLRDSKGRLNRAFGDIREFLLIASQQQIQVVVFTNPFHQEYWSLLEKHDLAELNSEWIREITDVVRVHGGDSVGLWDFSQDSPYIHESVPPSGIKSGPLNWFWEPAHYRKELGDLMIEAMMSQTCGGKVRFGEKLI